MKKFFTFLLCAFVALTANAQLEITNGGKPVTEGSNITFYATEEDDGYGDFLIECNSNEPFIKNVSGKDIDVTITVKKLQCPENASLTVCSLGACSPMMSESITKSGTIKAGEVGETAVHAMWYFQGEYGTCKVEVTIQAGAFKRTFTEEFIYTDNPQAGIENTKADQITVANNQMVYNFSSSADRQLNIYGVSGRLVQSESLSQHGVVALNNLHRGVYIYEINTNGKRSSAHKFIVK